MVLTATRRPMIGSIASYTRPMPPSPMTRTSLYLPIVSIGSDFRSQARTADETERLCQLSPVYTIGSLIGRREGRQPRGPLRPALHDCARTCRYKKRYKCEQTRRLRWKTAAPWREERPLRLQTIRRAGWLFAATSFVAMVAPSGSQPARAGRPNVLLVLLDDSGYGQTGTFGGLIPTPTLDSLASSGLRFTRFHVAALCSPTR